MSNPNLYTIGWICAIGTELTAAKAFLDAIHDSPATLPSQNTNSYTLGRLGSHNVVIAVLPDGEYGTDAAAVVARDMLHSFTNVRIGLMVGIGGGVPSMKHDIRLGDVVVSVPRNNQGGVCQYDFGKSIQDQSFQMTRFLNQPPTIVRTAVNVLKSQYEMEGHRLHEDISIVLDQYPRLRKRYNKPNISSDRLYNPDFIHVSIADDGDCVASCGCDPTNLISRPPRGEEEDNPTIHYGLIASGSKLMKDATLRDKLAAEKDVLCFEMEAAGLMNHFPCLVVRGICDYADSHKNDIWHGYAAMTAVAYAKNLLSRIAPTQVESEQRLADVLDSVNKIEIKVDNIRSHINGEEELKILNWLTPVNYGPIHSDILRRRQPGTGQWLTDSAEYQRWLSETGQTLFCTGIPGAGKTILTSIVVDKLTSDFSDDRAVGIAYIYCNFRRQHEQTYESLVASLLKQLCQRLPSMSDEVRLLHASHQAQQTRPTVGELAGALEAIIPTLSRIFVIIDALDECRTSDRSRSEFLAKLFRLRKQYKINVFATSRFDPDLHVQFEDGLRLDVRARTEDIKKFLDQGLSPARFFLRNNEQLQKEMKDAIVEAADGMFLLARLHLDSLIAKMTEGDVKRAMQNLPTGSNAYNQAYDDALIRIKEQGSYSETFAQQILLWIVFACRPLSIREVQNALSVKLNQSKYDQTCEPDIRDLISVCAGLVTIEDETDTVRLVHYTTQQYFEQIQDRWLPDAHVRITRICVTFLSFTNFDRTLCQTVGHLHTLLEIYPFWDYAANHWGFHARDVSSLPAEVVTFLNDTTKVDSIVPAMRALVKRGGHGSVPYFSTSPLTYQYYVDGAGYIEEPDHGYTLQAVTGLHLAIHEGLEAGVRLLLNRIEMLNVQDSWGCTPLYWAARRGRDKILNLLLDEGHDPKARAFRGQTPFSIAAIAGHLTILQTLVIRGKVAPDSQLPGGFNRYSGRTALSCAAANGHDDVVAWLLNQPGVNANRVGLTNSLYAHDRTALSYAAQHGHTAIVKRLLQRAEIEPDFPVRRPSGPGSRTASPRLARTPLSYAAANERDDIVELLLEHPMVNPDAPSIDGKTPLFYAAEAGHLSIVERLLERADVDPNAQDQRGWTALKYAVHEGRTTVAKFLIRKTYSNLQSSGDGGDLILIAVEGFGDAKLVEFLIQEIDFDINIRDEWGRTPLSCAAERGKVEVVRLLLERADIEVNTPNNHGRTPLSCAVADEEGEVIKLLLGHGDIDVNRRDEVGRSPLSYAAERNSVRIVGLLLAQPGIDSECKDSYGRTPLSYASEWHQSEVIELLQHAGANQYSEDGTRRPSSMHTTCLRWTIPMMTETAQRMPDVRRGDKRDFEAAKLSTEAEQMNRRRTQPWFDNETDSD